MASPKVRYDHIIFLDADMKLPKNTLTSAFFTIISRCGVLLHGVSHQLLLDLRA
jgi:hypothetical protein